MFCPKCHKNHKVDPNVIAKQFAEGLAQIVTKRGVVTLCLQQVQRDAQTVGK